MRERETLIEIADIVRETNRRAIVSKTKKMVTKRKKKKKKQQIQNPVCSGSREST